MNSTTDLAVLSWLIFWFDFAIRIFIGARIVKRKLPAGVIWAWLSLITFVPFMGTTLYLFFGEYRQPRRRLRRLRSAKELIRKASHVWSNESLSLGLFSPLGSAYAKMFGIPTQTGNEIELLDDAAKSFVSLISDVETATRTIDLEFYIWCDGGLADDFGQALIRAVGRGVRVRLLVDAIGSKKFIAGSNFQKLKEVGVQVCVALPSGFWRSLIARPDLRIHRKIAVIDDSIGYTGSLNLADPKVFKADAGVGHWVDAMARVRGPAVKSLYAVFLSDWCAETEANFATEIEQCKWQDLAKSGEAVIQCLPSGPAVADSNIEQALIMAINSSRREITLTTPYFVPSDALRYALMGAARRDVRTNLVIPKKVDSVVTHYASRSFLEELIDAGVKVSTYRKGLLHTKSVTVDGELSLFGSLNLDPRSLRINFEITLAVYDQNFTKALTQLQNSYIQESDHYTKKNIEEQTPLMEWKCALARLVGPLL